MYYIFIGSSSIRYISDYVHIMCTYKIRKYSKTNHSKHNQIRCNVFTNIIAWKITDRNMIDLSMSIPKTRCNMVEHSKISSPGSHRMINDRR